MKKNNITSLILCAFFAALSAVLAQISISIGPIPIAFTHISVFICAGILGAKYGAISQSVYVLLGAVGVPVFAGFKGGAAAILGPTGGFIFGYIACVLIAGLIMDKFGRKIWAAMLAMAAGLLVNYVFGTIWFVILLKSDIITALTACVFPFLIGDVLKIILSAVLVNRLYAVLKKIIKS